MKPRIAIMGIGDGGGEMALAQATWLYDNSPQTLASVVVAFANTNAGSLSDMSRRLSAINPQIQQITLQLGPKTTRRSGTGSMWASGRKAARESIEDGLFKRFLELYPVETIFADASWGAGGTGLGGQHPIVSHLRDLSRMVFPVVMYGSIEFGNVDEGQNLVMQERLKELDRDGLPVNLCLVSSVKDEAVSSEEAYLKMNQVLAHALGGFSRVLANPYRYDRNDILVRLYANADKSQRKRIRMSGVTFSSKDLENPDSLGLSVKRLFNNRHFDFDNARIGGAMFALEHDGSLMLKDERVIYNTLKELMEEAFKKQKPTEVMPLHFKPVAFNSSKPGEISMTLILSEYTGWVQELSELPDITWRADSTDDEEESEQPKFSIAASSSSSATSLATLNAQPPASTPEAPPAHSTENDKPTTNGKSNGIAIIVSGPKEPVQTASQPIAASKLKVVMAYDSVFALVDAAERHGDAGAEDILEKGDPTKGILPDGRSAGEVLLFSLQGEELLQQVLLAIHSLSKLKRKWDREKRSFSEAWMKSMKEALLLRKGALLPEKVADWKVIYDFQQVTSRAWWPSLSQEDQALLTLGCKIAVVFGADVASELVITSGDGKGHKGNALTGVSAMLRSAVGGIR